MQTILLVDPETDFLEWAQNQLETPTTRVLTATTADEGYKVYISENPDLLVSETHLMPFSGLELLARIRQRDTNALVILMSAFGTTQSVIESMKLGAFDYLRKESLPFNLKPVVDAALTAQAEMRSATAFKPQLTVEQYQDSLVGQSQAMQQVYGVPFERFERYCPAGTPEDVAEFLAPYVAAGCTEFNLIPQAPAPDQAVAGVAAVRNLLAATRVPSS